MKKLNYDELLNTYEKERYEALMNVVEEHWNTRVEWKLVNEYFDITLDTVTVEILAKNYIPTGVKVSYDLSRDMYYVITSSTTFGTTNVDKAIRIIGEYAKVSA